MELAADHDCAWKTEAEALRARLALLEPEAAELATKLAGLEHQLDVRKRQVFGKKSEKMPRPLEALKKRGDVAKQTPEERKAKREEASAWKNELLEVELLEVLPSELPTCELCHTVPEHPLPAKTTYSYEEIPARIVCRKHVQPQVRCECGSCIVTAPAPRRIFDKCQYGEKLCAHLITAKCADAIAIERFARQLARLGVPVAASTLGSLFHRCAELLTPLYDRLLALIAAQAVVQADETRIQVQAKGKTRRAWVWTFLADELVAYVFSANRSGETPRNVLGGTTGTLLVDGYTGYNQVCKLDNRQRAGCLAHVRRELFDAMKSAPDLQVALDLILDVYKVEHKAMAAGIVRTPAHAELRRTEGKAAMDALHIWLKAHHGDHLPTSAAGQAIGYALNQWSHLTVFLGLVHVPIDNNKSERMLRILARGRASYLFVGNDDAGQNLAILMSLVLTAELCGKNPQAYLADVLLRIQDHPASRIDELLPQNWVPAEANSA
jgi:transposase